MRNRVGFAEGQCASSSVGKQWLSTGLTVWH